MSAIPHLQKQLKDLQQKPVAGFRVEVNDDIFHWIVWFAGPKDSHYCGGFYKAQLTFHADFPFKPPEMKILSSFWHPNVYPDGKVCISILHEPGTDQFDPDETADFRWTPVQSIEKVLVSVISLLTDPDPSGAGAPANVDALVQFRKDRTGYDKRCRDLAVKSLKELPGNFIPPPEEDAPPPLSQQATDVTMVLDDLDEDLDEDLSDMGEGTVGMDGSGLGSGGGPDGEGEYACEMRQVKDMGLADHLDDDSLRALMVKYKGDVSRIMENL